MIEETAPFARRLARPASLAAFWIVIAAPSLSTNTLAESAGIGPGSSAPAAETSPDVRQSWEDDYASLKVALSKRDNRYALLRTGEERQDVAHIQSLLWESDRTGADVALRRTAALLEHLKSMPQAPDLGAWEKQLAAARSRNTGAADDKETGFRPVDLQSLVESLRARPGGLGEFGATGRWPLRFVRAQDRSRHCAQSAGRRAFRERPVSGAENSGGQQSRPVL
jgi:hypothetical protein